MQKSGKAPKPGRMPGGVRMDFGNLSERTRVLGTIPRGQGPKATRIDEANHEKEYDLIMLRDEVAEIFKFCPYICRTAKKVYTFTVSPEEAKRTGADGISCRANMSIGINTEIMSKKYGDVWKMAYIHELAHLLSPGYGHSLEFHRLLDAMLELYNQETGARLKNNYFGLKEGAECQSAL